ncbi:MAG: carotenoid oxygenase family protein [Alphaproteobacteria bacterium]
MAQPFPENRYLTGNYAPLRMEGEAPDLLITGEMPRELNGTLFRNGPNPQFAPRNDKYHWFLGDGMIHAITFDDGKVHWRNRWVRTEKFEAERKAGETLMASSFNDMTPDPRAAGIPLNVANTAIVHHGGKLLALEEGSPPVHLDATTLATHGPWTFDGKYGGAMTAHPRVDPKTGEMVFFAYFGGMPGEPKVALNWVAKDGTLTRSEILDVPYCSMIHDFLITENYIILPIFPATVDLERIIAGGPFVAWDEKQTSHVGLIPRNGDIKDTKWFEAPPAYVFHPLNGYETADGKVVADMVQYDRAPLFNTAGGTNDALEDNSSKLIRWELDPAANTSDFKQTQLDDFTGEFPRHDERYTGHENRYGYFCIKEDMTQNKGPFNMILARDMLNHTAQKWNAGEGVYVQEPIFVPRNNAVAEGDGFLVAPTYNVGSNTSDIVVLDAMNVSAGPVATAHLPTRIPYGFHGTWKDA